jgi:cytochrome c-type biogenesis protein CcmH/NrfF
MRRHPLDLLSLLAGVTFTLVGASALLGRPLPLSALQLRWGVPVIAVAAGVWLLVTGARRTSHQTSE